MPFIQNGTAYVTGEVPARDLKRLNGNQQDYPKRAKTIVCGVLPLVLFALVPVFGVWKPFGRDGSTIAILVLVVAAICIKYIWDLCSPRALNQGKWNKYRYDKRLFTSEDAVFRLAMSPAVVAAINDSHKTLSESVTVSVDEFFDWYAKQPAVLRQEDDSRGPIARSDAALLSELRYKLEVGVNSVLPSNSDTADMVAYIDSVLIKLREAYRDDREADSQKHKDEYEAADSEAKYQRGQLVALRR